MKRTSICLVLLALLFGAAPQYASAKPRMDFHFKDECKNIKGKQPIYAILESHVYEFVGPRSEHICIEVHNPHGDDHDD